MKEFNLSELKKEIEEQEKQGYLKHFKCSKRYKDTGEIVCGLCYLKDLKKRFNKLK